MPLETLVRKFSYMRFEPEGMTSNPEIPFAKSMPDYIMRWLASRFLDVDLQEELGILTPAVRARQAAQEAASSHHGDVAAAARPRRPSPATETAATPPHAGAAGHVRADRLAAGDPHDAAGARPRPGLPAVRRDDAAHRQLLHVLELRVQHRLRLILKPQDAGSWRRLARTLGAPQH